MLIVWNEVGMEVWWYCDMFFDIVGYISWDIDSYIIKYFSNYEDFGFGNVLIEKLKYDD